MLTGKNDNAIKHIKPYQTCFKGIQSCHVLSSFGSHCASSDQSANHVASPVSFACHHVATEFVSGKNAICMHISRHASNHVGFTLHHTTSIFVKGAHWSLLGLWPYEATHAMKPRFPQHTSIEERLIGMWDLWHNGLWPHETKSSWSPLTVRQSPTVPLQRGPPSTQARIVARYHVEKRSFDRWPTS